MIWLMHSLCAFFPEREKQEVMIQRVTEAKAVCPFTSILLASKDNRTGAGHWDTGLSNSPENRASLENPVRKVEVPNTWAWSLDEKQGHAERLSVRFQS